MRRQVDDLTSEVHAAYALEIAAARRGLARPLAHSSKSGTACTRPPGDKIYEPDLDDLELDIEYPSATVDGGDAGWPLFDSQREYRSAAGCLSRVSGRQGVMSNSDHDLTPRDSRSTCMARLWFEREIERAAARRTATGGRMSRSG